VELYLSDRHGSLRDSVRDFARSEVAPGADERDRAGEFPAELIARMGQQRWMGIPFPAEFGGLGADTLAFVLAIEELAAVDSGLAGTVSAHTWMGTLPVHLFGSEQQRSGWLPWLCTGQRLAAFAANPGTQPGKSAAVLKGGVWTLNGTEHSVVNAGTPLTGCLSVTVASGPGQGCAELSTILIPGGSPGYHVGDRIDRIGWRSGDTHTVSLAECRVAEGGLLGPRGGGLDQFLQVIEANRIGLAAIGVGIAQAALDEASTELRHRHAVPDALPVFALEAQVVDLSARIEAVRLLTWRAALERDHDQSFALTAAQARLAAGDLALGATEAAMQARGGFGEIEEGTTWRLFRDARMLASCDGSQETQRAAVASELGFGAERAVGSVPSVSVPRVPMASVPEPPVSTRPAGLEPMPSPSPPVPSDLERSAPVRVAPDLPGILASETGVALLGLGLGVLVCLLLLASWRV